MKLSIAFGIAAMALAPMSAAAAPCTKNCPKPAVGGGGKGGLPGLKGAPGGGLFKPGGSGGSPFGGRPGTGAGQGGLVRGGQGGLTRGGRGPMVRGGGGPGGHSGGLYARGGAPLRATDGRTYMFHGRRYGAFRAARFHWRHGYGYRAYGIGAVFPFAAWPSEYYISDYYDYGLDAPPPGYWWIRNGPDLLLINGATGEVAQDVPGAIEEDAGPGPDDSGGPPPPDDGYGGPPDQGPGPGDDQQAGGYGPPQDGGYGPPQDGGYGPPQDAGPPPPPPPPPCHGFWCAVQSTIQNAACNSQPGGCPPPDQGGPQD